MEEREKNNKSNQKRVELKYCERCGGLWLRECGSGLIYCGVCRNDISELPLPKKRPQTVHLPTRRRPAIDEFRFDASADRVFKPRTGGAA